MTVVEDGEEPMSLAMLEEGDEGWSDTMTALLAMLLEANEAEG